MAKRAVEVSECDRCGKEPAHTWRITGPDGAPREIELCDQHGSPIANAYALARPIVKPVPKKKQQQQQSKSSSARSARKPVAALPPPPPEPIWR